jgi:hypothetical protein
VARQNDLSLSLPFPFPVSLILFICSLTYSAHSECRFAITETGFINLNQNFKDYSSLNNETLKLSSFWQTRNSVHKYLKFL